MSEVDLLDKIRKTTTFHGMEDEHLSRVANIAQLVEFPPHASIFTEDEPGQNVYVVINGSVSLSICTPEVGCRQLAEIFEGEMIGWSPLVGRSHMSDTARTITATTLIAIKGEDLLALCRDEPRFGVEFMHRGMRTLAERLGAVRLQLLQMTGHRLPMAVYESD